MRKTVLYRYQSAETLYLDFTFHHPVEHKKGVIRASLTRAESLSSIPSDELNIYSEPKNNETSCSKACESYSVSERKKECWQRQRRIVLESHDLM